ncbi:MAG: 4-(cytidine 5'-diphospho)-2-C-methyl-D-erythritol kinase [Rhodococcus sp.]|nr:4-(cytidine 5'-diphospho)-2-C-methyl-D-erythritol kinase [Rhodococcus sp. (in: high G+C Gram-positive bacteria)]
MLSVVHQPVVVRAPSKVNLHLSVGDLRPDGYHDLTTVFQALSLYDTVSVVPHQGSEPIIEVHGQDAQLVPTDHTNLVWTAAQEIGVPAQTYNRDTGMFDLGVKISIEKTIPVAGGMAGGSTDAAGALVALNKLWGVDYSRAELAEIAGAIGSDVPFCVHGGTAMGTGRGEEVVPVLSRNTFHWVLAIAKDGLSTPAVFKELDRLRAEGNPPRVGDPQELLQTLASGGDAAALAPLLSNDLQAAAISLQPGLRRTLRAGVEAGALAGIVSGSGPTCAFLCADHDSAIEVGAELSGAGVARSVRVAFGPVPGARLETDA